MIFYLLRFASQPGNQGNQGKVSETNFVSNSQEKSGNFQFLTKSQGKTVFGYGNFQ